MSFCTKTCDLHMRKDYRCNGYIIHYVFCTKKSEMVLYFIGVYIINRTLHDRLEIWISSSRVKKYSTCSLHSLAESFSTLWDKILISVQLFNILYFHWQFCYSEGFALTFPFRRSQNFRLWSRDPLMTFLLSNAKFKQVTASWWPVNVIKQDPSARLHTCDTNMNNKIVT